MAAATSRRRPAASRAERMAKLLARHGFGPVSPVRVVPDEEALYRAIDPMTFAPSYRFVAGRLVGLAKMHRTRRRAYALRVLLARRLSRMSLHHGFAVMWAGCAREDLYRFRAEHRAYLYARAEEGSR